MMRTLIAAALAASCATGWAAEAQFELKDVPAIVDYLARNYGKP